MAACFVIMPISTPASVAEKYGGDSDHFAHILEHLFVPAITKAGYEPVRPSTEGGDIIQAHIIRCIQSADIVLCDISSLNANVFFELGVRTALNLPAIVIRDGYTPLIPFDTGIINHHTYNGNMSAWILPNEIEKLSQHIVTAANSARGENSLWRYFGIAGSAQPAVSNNSTEEKLDYALHLLKSLRSESVTTHTTSTAADPDSDPQGFIAVAQSMADTVSAKFVTVDIDGRNVILNLGRYVLTDELRESIQKIASSYGVSAQIVYEPLQSKREKQLRRRTEI